MNQTTLEDIEKQREDWIDRAAIAAMQGMLANDAYNSDADESIAENAYKMAEAMWFAKQGTRTIP
jgi:hypothetical protein